MAGLLDFDALDPAQYSVSDEERKKIIFQNLMFQLAPALAGSRKGELLQGAAFGLTNGAMAAQQGLAGAQQGKYDKLKMGSALMDYQGKKQAYEDDKTERNVLQNFKPMSPLDASVGSAAGAPAGAAPAPQGGGMYAQLNALADQFQAAGLGKKAEKYREEAQKYRPKFSTEPRIGVDPQTGQPFNYLVDEQGNMKKLDGAGVAPKFREVNDGKTTRILNEYNIPQTGANIAMQTTPGQDQTNAVAQAQLALARNADHRAAAAANKADGPTLDASTGQYFYKPDAQNPTGRVVQAAGFTAKPPEHTRKEMDNIDAQLNIVDGARSAAKAVPSAFGMGRGLATMGGNISESIASKASTSEQRQARAYVYNVVSSAINERAGAAQSVQELARLRSFLPGETDNSKEIEDKLTGFETYLKDKRKAYSGGGKPSAAKTINFADLPQ